MVSFEMLACIKYVLLLQIAHNLIICSNAQLTSTFIKPLASGTCGISTGGPLIQQLTTTLTDTSGLFWSDDGIKLPYVERFGPAYGRYTPGDGRFNRMAINEGKEAIAVFPVKNATGLKFVIGLDNRLVLANVTGSGNSLQSKITHLIDVSNRDETFMKGKIDNHGRLWYSSAGSWSTKKGKLYKIDNLQKPEVMVDKLSAGAGMGWTKDYKYFYLVDSNLGVIYKYDFNENDGAISNKRTIFKNENYNTDGYPYDIAIDDEGYIWIGMFENGAVLKYNETSQKILWTISIPASYIVSLEFGGLDRKTLYVGTTRHFLFDAEKEPNAGAIFAISGTGATGFPDNEIVIPEKYRN